MSKWPPDNQAALIAFYGNPGTGEVARQLVKVTPPFQLYYDGKPLKTISFHKKAAPALIAALNEIWEYYGKDQAKIDALRISHCAGTYNPRKIRGSATKWSNHAYGAAIDFDAEHNGFGTGKGTMPKPVIAAFKRQGARWGGDYKGRTDPMHFEFCDAGLPQTFADLPEADSDDDVKKPTQPDVPKIAPDDHVEGMKVPLFKRIWTWVSGAGVSIAGFLYDYRIVIAVAVTGLVIALFLLWLFGKTAIKNWIAQQV